MFSSRSLSARIAVNVRGVFHLGEIRLHVGGDLSHVDETHTGPFLFALGQHRGGGLLAQGAARLGDGTLQSARVFGRRLVRHHVGVPGRRLLGDHGPGRTVQRGPGFRQMVGVLVEVRPVLLAVVRAENEVGKNLARTSAV